MQLVCPACGNLNQVPEERYRNEPECVRCSASLMSAEPVAQTDDGLPTFISCNDLPVVVCFLALWSEPSDVMALVYADAARQIPEVRFVKIDNDSSPVASARFKIRTIPTLILFKSGIEIAQISGARSAAQLVSWIKDQLQA